jgi:hypothetical protein
MRRMIIRREDSEDADKFSAVSVFGMAHSNYRMYLMSAVGSRSSADSAAALIRSGKQCKVTYEAQKERNDDMPFRVTGKWKTWTTCLGYDSWHMLAVSNDEMFLPVCNRNHFWRLLRNPKFTTPVIKSWCQPILDECLHRKHVIRLSGIGDMNAAYCFAEDVHLDAVVSHLLKKRTIKIERSAA